jgi:hypothetical protein
VKADEIQLSSWIGFFSDVNRCIQFCHWLAKELTQEKKPECAADENTP